jgi:hypothetical protein
MDTNTIRLKDHCQGYHPWIEVFGYGYYAWCSREGCNFSMWKDTLEILEEHWNLTLGDISYGKSKTMIGGDPAGIPCPRCNHTLEWAEYASIKDETEFGLMCPNCLLQFDPEQTEEVLRNPEL